MGYKTESNKSTNKKNNQTKTHRHRQQYGHYKMEGVWGVIKYFFNKTGTMAIHVEKNITPTSHLAEKSTPGRFQI